MRAWHSLWSLATSTVLVACTHPPTGGVADVSKPAVVQIAVAATADVPDTVTLPATVTRERVARLASPYGGRVTAVAVATGSAVHSGELLLTIGAEDARSRLANAAASATAARAEAAQAAADDVRFKALRAQQAVAPREYEQIHKRYIAAQAQARAAAQTLAAARADFEFAELRAPFAGLLAERTVKPGDYAAPGTLLAVVVGGTPEAELAVGDVVYPHLRLGTNVAVTIYGRRYAGTVIERVDAADPVSRTHKVKLRLSGKPAPPYGTYAQVHVPVDGSRAVVVVPSAAVVKRAGLIGVFVVDAHHRAQFRTVRIGNGVLDRKLTEVAAGLEPGDRIVVGPPLSLGNGTPVHEAGFGAKVGHG